MFTINLKCETTSNKNEEPPPAFNGNGKRNYWIVWSKKEKQKNNKTWESRKRRVKKAIENIIKNIMDDKSKINKKLSKCITDSLKKLIDPGEDYKKKLRGAYHPIKIILCDKDAKIKKNSDKNKWIARMAVVHKNRINFEKDHEKYYNGVLVAEIKIYEGFWNDIDASRCLEGYLFHEILHSACFDNKEKWLGEKIAYGCSHKIYRCALYKNPEDNNKDYSKECNEKTCKEEKENNRQMLEYQEERRFSDKPDDNYSVYENKSNKKYVFGKTNYIIYKNGDCIHMDNLVGGIYYEGFSSLRIYNERRNVIIFPSGGLNGIRGDYLLKQTLKQYVSQGGTIIVFSQQYGSHVENIVPIPEGEKLKVYGWRQDQSCYLGSVYTEVISIEP